jgi:hypothetical protein
LINVARQLASILLKVLDVFRVALVVALDLAPQIVAGVSDEMAMVKGFDAGLEGEGDKETNRDHPQLQEEISPSPGRVMKRMNVHVRSPPIDRISESVQGADLVPVRVAKIGEIQFACTAFANTIMM